MSVVFDVLDSLNSIRNVEDLKKRWEVDSKRSQTLSFEAVDMFVSLFSGDPDTDEFIVRLSNFTLRYREAVVGNACPVEELAWIMPYVRYAEKLKSYIALGDLFNFEPDSFALKCRKKFASEHTFTEAYNVVNQFDECVQQVNDNNFTPEQIAKLFVLFQSLYLIAENGDEDWDWLTHVAIPDYDIGNNCINPWNLNPKADEYDNSFDEYGEDFATLFPYFGVPIVYDLEIYSKYEPVFSFLSDAENIKKIHNAKNNQFNLNYFLETFSSNYARVNYRQFMQIMGIISDESLSAFERLKKIQIECKDKLPWNFNIKLRYAIEPLFIEYIKKEINNIKVAAEVNLGFEEMKLFKALLPEDIFSYCAKTYFSPQIYEAAIREDERRKVLFEMSHSIKNLLASVSEPLGMLKEQLEGTQRRTVENALAGAGLIRDLAVGVHMSMRGEPGAWRKDVLEPGFGAATLDKIILDAVRHAVSNMFDGKYFAQFVKNYFGKDLNTFMQAQNEWKAAVSAEDTFACINKYFFDFKIDCRESSLNIPIGDRDGTATKLLILFQELFLNAVKYSSFTEREKRFVKLDIAITQKNWNIKLSNSAVGRQNAKSSGIGLAVIKNFADLFEAKYDASCKNDTYISNINFSLNK